MTVLGAMIVVTGAAGSAFPVSPGAAQAPIPVTKARTSTRGVTRTRSNVVFPVNLQANAFLPVLEDQSQQQYFSRLLLSDFPKSA